MFRISVTGNNKNICNRLNALMNIDTISILNKYGKQGAQMLSDATPKDTGVTSEGWYYKIVKQDDKYSLIFCNSNVNDGANVAFILQNGHITSTGTWVEGVNYINPALAPIYEQIKNDIWREMSK